MRHCKLCKIETVKRGRKFCSRLCHEVYYSKKFYKKLQTYKPYYTIFIKYRGEYVSYVSCVDYLELKQKLKYIWQKYDGKTVRCPEKHIMLFIYHEKENMTYKKEIKKLIKEVEKYPKIKEPEIKPRFKKQPNVYNKIYKKTYEEIKHAGTFFG